MRTCHVLGLGGFDLDVLHNITRFYRSLGFRTFYSREPAKADLLVALRPRGLGVAWKNYGAVHIWDYVGGHVNDVGALMDPAPANVLVLASPKTRADELNAHCVDLEGRVKVLLPPVDVPFWTESRTRARSRPTVHIGHYKSSFDNYGADDVYTRRFLRLLRDGRTEIWGDGWAHVHEMTSRGRLNLYGVSRVYASTSVAFGMMYPHQRTRTLSGRFWHAPLNGCILISEPSAYAGGVVPGVIESTYDPDDIQKLLRELPEPNEIQRDAAAYWGEQFELAREEIAGYLPGARKFRVEVAASVFRGSLDNAGRSLWHRIR